jgi:hypothetical protein
MLQVLDIIEKLKDILSQEENQKRIFDKDVAIALEISQANFATMKIRNKIPFSSILDFCAVKKISINWLLYGQDPSSLIDSTDKYWIRYYPGVMMSAGGGGSFDDINYEKLELPNYFIKMMGGNSMVKTIEAINVTGESMEPSLNDGDIIFVDIAKNQYSKDGIYAIYADDALLVKRIQNRTDGMYDIISDNNIFSNQTINKNELKIYGKVISSFGNVF